MYKELLNSLETREKDLCKLIEAENLRLKNMPEGSLRISGREGCKTYYWCKDSSDKNGKYLRKEQLETAKLLAQTDYDQAVKASAEKELKELRKLIRIYHGKNPEDVFTSKCEERQSLITPIELPLEQFVAAWQAETYEGNPYAFAIGAGEFFTEKKERVRSKSELCIADMLARRGIPYHYEKPLHLSNGKIVYPDFTCLNIEKRKEVYWEHFGMMDDPAYCEKTLQKIAQYEQNGIFPGDELIISFEGIRNPLGTRNIEYLIEHYLLNS